MADNSMPDLRDDDFYGEVPDEVKPCPDCGGDGMEDDVMPCPTCGGEGDAWWL